MSQTDVVCTELRLLHVSFFVIVMKETLTLPLHLNHVRCNLQHR